MSWLPKKSVVVPIDFSDASLEAVKTAADMVEEFSHLHLVHVLPKLSPMEPGVIWGTVDDESRSRHATDALREKLAGTGSDAATITIGFGDPAHEIAEMAEAKGAELIVIPSHGRTGAKHVLLGSVAERVARFAHCPVLVLRNHEAGLE